MFGTHPSLPTATRIDEVGVLCSQRVVLPAGRRYYDPLRLPLGCRFPVLPVMGGGSLPVPLWRVDGPQLGPTAGPHMVCRSPSWGTSPPHVGSTGPAPAAIAHLGPEEGLSSSQDSLLAVQRPLRRRVLGHPLQDPGCCPWPSPTLHRLGSLWSAFRRGANDACPGFAAAADWTSCSPPCRGFVAPLRRRDLARRREPCYRGPWRLPGPDSHWLVVLSLSLGLLLSTTPFRVVALRPEPSGRTKSRTQKNHAPPRRISSILELVPGFEPGT